jgi:hypothetical protein
VDLSEAQVTDLRIKTVELPSGPSHRMHMPNELTPTQPLNKNDPQSSSRPSLRMGKAMSVGTHAEQS